MLSCGQILLNCLFNTTTRSLRRRRRESRRLRASNLHHLFSVGKLRVVAVESRAPVQFDGWLTFFIFSPLKAEWRVPKLWLNVYGPAWQRHLLARYQFTAAGPDRRTRFVPLKAARITTACPDVITIFFTGEVLSICPLLIRNARVIDQWATPCGHNEVYPWQKEVKLTRMHCCPSVIGYRTSCARCSLGNNSCSSSLFVCLPQCAVVGLPPPHFGNYSHHNMHHVVLRVYRRSHDYQTVVDDAGPLIEA